VHNDKTVSLFAILDTVPVNRNTVQQSISVVSDIRTVDIAGNKAFRKTFHCHFTALIVSAYFCSVAYAKACFWRKMFYGYYSDNLLLSLLAIISLSFVGLRCVMPLLQ